VVDVRTGDRRRELASTGDPRAARTRERVVAALEELLAEDAPVSVAALCTRAEVGRSTFYTHFATVGDVVVHVVDSMFDELGALDVSRRRGHAMPRAAITRLGMQELLAALQARRRFFLYAVSAPATERVRERLVGEMSDSLRDTILVERPDVGDSFLRTSGDFIAGGVFGVLLGWLQEARDRSTDEVVEDLVALLPGWLTGPGDAERPPSGE
jgi:AcrR family transcriptional regulator